MASLVPPSTLRQVQPDGAVLLAGPNLRLRMVLLRPGVMLVTARGEVIGADDVKVEVAMLQELEAELARAGQLKAFADLRESQRMPSTSRERIAIWAKRHESRVVEAHVLLRSKLLEMAMSIVSMLVGSDRVAIHTSQSAFLALVKRAAPDFSELPRAPD